MMCYNTTIYIIKKVNPKTTPFQSTGSPLTKFRTVVCQQASVQSNNPQEHLPFSFGSTSSDLLPPSAHKRNISPPPECRFRLDTSMRLPLEYRVNYTLLVHTLP